MTGRPAGAADECSLARAADNGPAPGRALPGGGAAAGRPAAASSAAPAHAAARITDGDQDPYWQSRGRGPHWVQTDLGASVGINGAVLTLPGDGGATVRNLKLQGASEVFQGIRINNVDIVDPTYSGIVFQTDYVGGRPEYPIKDTILTDISITGARRSGDAYDAESGFGLWANELPEPG